MVGSWICPIRIDAGSPAASLVTTENANVATPPFPAGPLSGVRVPYSSKCASCATSTNSRVEGHHTFNSSTPQARWVENASTTDTVPSW